MAQTAAAHHEAGQDLAEVRRSMFAMSERIGEIRGDIKLLMAGQERIEATVIANQAANEAAHARKDDRINALGAALAARTAEESVKRRLGSGLIAVLAGIFGALATFFAQLLGGHLWAK